LHSIFSYVTILVNRQWLHSIFSYVTILVIEFLRIASAVGLQQVVVCISARSAVAVLNELSSLKVRVAKIFPNNGSAEEQCEQHSLTSFGLAVGTPHRLQLLYKSGEEENRGLTLDRTQLVILDSDVSNNQYTVCKLPDTLPHCMNFLNESILPQL
jgi:hypothetical protein